MASGAASRFADDDGSRSSRDELLLDVHLQRSEAWAARLAQRLGLPEPQQMALVRAGRSHDLGKQRRVWQRSIKRYKDPPLAKGPMQPSELAHYRPSPCGPGISNRRDGQTSEASKSVAIKMDEPVCLLVSRAIREANRSCLQPHH